MIMKTEIEVTEAAVSGQWRFCAGTAPSLRVPVTAANRALLRWLRREELSAWEAGRVCGRGPAKPERATPEFPFTPTKHNL